MSETSAGNGAGHGFGTLPVFLAGISTILGAIMFLRFGYAVGNVGLVGALGVIVLGHLVTVPTALALAEIATNRKVEGGGEYYIISRSFGRTIGAVIGISLYLSQAISVAFYMIALAEAFRPLGAGTVFDLRLVSMPATIGLIALMLTKGAALGVRALYIVVLVLAASLILFFLGSPVDGYSPETLPFASSIANADQFFIVFAICFPAFTGMTAGVGLSGDLANPRVSLPRGTMAATLVGMAVYVLLVIKMAASAPPELLDSDPLVMSRIAIWGPIIPIGLACATLSSAIGSILVAPRTLQALGSDGSFPIRALNRWTALGRGAVNEPRNATLVTGVLALVIVALGNVDFVARLISMFFMVTYGSLCAISFLEHFAARPSYRPSFRSRWYVSMFGAAMCVFMMFQMDPLFAIIALVAMTGLYLLLSRTSGERGDLAAMFEGVMTQLTRYLQIRLQPRRNRMARDEWRPSIIMLSDETFERRAPLLFLRWLSHRHGFGTYLHYIKGLLNPDTSRQGEKARQKMVALAKEEGSAVYVDSIVSPSMISALAQSLQLPGVSGLSNNTVMFELSEHDEAPKRGAVAESVLFAGNTRKTLLVLRHGDNHFGARRKIHVWLTWNDRSNANSMILLSYLLLDHPDWRKAEISVFAALPRDQVEEMRLGFQELMRDGRLPVSEKNIRFLSVDDVESYRRLVARLSTDADLTVLGFDLESLRERREDMFTSHPALKDVLFVHAPEQIRIE